MKLTIIEREAETFRAKFEVGENIDREITGTIKNKKVSWFAKDVRAVKGGPGGDNQGTLSKDQSGYKIDFAWRTAPGGRFTLRLSTARLADESPGARTRSKTPAQAPTTPNEQSPAQSYVIVFDFDATKAKPGRSGEVLIPAPSDESYQKVSWDVRGAGGQRTVNAEGAKLIAVRPNGPRFQLRVAVEPMSREVPKTRAGAPVSADVSASLRNNATFAAQNPRTAQLVRQLKAADPAETVRNIHEWIRKNMSYRFDAKLRAGFASRRDAIDAMLEAKQGDCSSNAAVFVALCRQANIPARSIAGAIKIAGAASPPKGSGLPADLPQRFDFCAHTRAEIYLDGRGWVPVEPGDAETPLGRVPGDFVPFIRLAFGYDVMQPEVGLAVTNVGSMNGMFFGKFEEAAEGSGGKASAGKAASGEKKSLEPRAATTQKERN